jgi:hypothetical protein
VDGFSHLGLQLADKGSGARPWVMVRYRALAKKMRAIEELETKREAGRGGTLVHFSASPEPCRTAPAPPCLGPADAEHQGLPLIHSAA